MEIFSVLNGLKYFELQADPSPPETPAKYTHNQCQNFSTKAKTKTKAKAKTLLLQLELLELLKLLVAFES